MIGKTHVWRDGCIVDNASGLANFCIYEVFNHNTFVEEMGKHIGFTLDPIIYNATVHASYNVIRNMLEPHPVLARLALSAPFYRLAERQICGIFKAIGAGSIELCEHSKCAHARARIADPFNLTQCLAITAGALQAIDGTRYSYEMVKEGDRAEVDFVPLPAETAREETYERLGITGFTPQRLPAAAPFNSCPKCGVPKVVGELLSFDLPHGVITKRDGGGRVILGGVASFNAMFRELEKELGDSVDHISSEIEKESTRRNLADAGLAGKAWDEAELRDHLALYGTGMLQAMEQDGDELSLEVANVYVPSLVAGRLAGIWENWHQEESAYDFSLENNALSMTIHPKT
ncbi:MAG: hypothetical protein C4536_11175 [Actinobacteria bacterium]|jgi:hypothetical protein|nr:MAG: hypothetical protein C4536_11175 [Actinomycetota bacterium]